MRIPDYISNLKSNKSGLALASVLLVAILLVAAFTTYLVLKDDYAVLFTDLSATDAALIMKDLDKNKIDYKVDNSGNNILVRKSEVYKTRIETLNSVPQLRGGVGFEIFDKDDFGTTEFAQKINYQRALQGELARTIMSLDEIKMARIHLVLPESSLFKRKDSHSSAAVTLILNPGKKLTARQIQGIQRLVSASAPGLLSKNVSILDKSGISLTSLNEDDNYITSKNRLDRKQAIETYLTSKAQLALDKAMGKGNALVIIDVTLDLDDTKSIVEQVISPQDKLANILKKRETASGDAKSHNRKTTSEIDYALSRQTKHTNKLPGAIKRISASVIISNHIAKYTQSQTRDIVSNAIGLNLARGDEISISSNDTSVSTMPKHDKAQTELNDGVSQANIHDKILNNDRVDTFVARAALKISMLITNHATAAFLIVILTIILVFVLLLIVVDIRMRKKHKSADKISEEEREKMLNDIRNILHSEKA